FGAIGGNGAVSGWHLDPALFQPLHVRLDAGGGNRSGRQRETRGGGCARAQRLSAGPLGSGNPVRIVSHQFLPALSVTSFLFRLIPLRRNWLDHTEDPPRSERGQTCQVDWKLSLATSHPFR